MGTIKFSSASVEARFDKLSDEEKAEVLRISVKQEDGSLYVKAANLNEAQATVASKKASVEQAPAPTVEPVKTPEPPAESKQAELPTSKPVEETPPSPVLTATPTLPVSTPAPVLIKPPPTPVTSTVKPLAPVKREKGDDEGWVQCTGMVEARKRVGTKWWVIRRGGKTRLPKNVYDILVKNGFVK